MQLRGRRAIDFSIGMQNIDNRQVVALSDLEVECVVCRRDFQNSRPELRIDRFVGDNWKLLAYERTPRMFADETGITTIAGMSRDGRIRHDRFGPSRRDFNEASGLFHDFVADIVKVSLLWLGNDFFVGQRGLRRRVPVDHATPAIDQALVIKIDKNPLDGSDVIIVERVALPRPVARTPESLELLDDYPAMFILPFHHPAHEFLAP